MNDSAMEDFLGTHVDLNVTSGNVTDNSSLRRGPDPDIFDQKGVSISFSVIYGVIWLCCVLGNIVVLVVMKRSPSLHNRTNLFLCHLAVADLSVGLVCIIPNIVHAHMLYWFPGPMGHFFCKFYSFVEEFSLTVSVLLLVLIATDRYVAIMHPLKARRLFTRRRMYAALVLIWLTASVYNIPMLVVYVTVVTNTNTTYCYKAWDIIDLPLYTVLNSVLTYVVPLVFMTVMYIRISLTLWRSSGGQPNFVQRDTTSSSLTSSKRLNACRAPSPHHTAAGTRRSPDGGDAANNADNRDGGQATVDDHHNNRGLQLAQVPESAIIPAPKDNTTSADDNKLENDNDDCALWSTSDGSVERLKRKRHSSSGGSCSCQCPDSEHCSRCSHNSRTSRTSRASSDVTTGSSSASSSSNHSDVMDRCHHNTSISRSHQTLEVKLSATSSTSHATSEGNNTLVISRSSSATSSTPLMPLSPITPVTTFPTTIPPQSTNVTSSALPVTGSGDGVYLLRRGNSAAGSCRLRVMSHRALMTRRK
ncbi:hypothetical protein BaRGS_00018405, partial [Batillaria attramentaria]